MAFAPIQAVRPRSPLVGSPFPPATSPSVSRLPLGVIVAGTVGRPPFLWQPTVLPLPPATVVVPFAATVPRVLVGSTRQPLAPWSQPIILPLSWVTSGPAPVATSSPAALLMGF